MEQRGEARAPYPTLTQVLELIVNEAHLDVVLDSVARWVEGELAGTTCSITLADPSAADVVVLLPELPGAPDATTEAVVARATQLAGIAVGRHRLLERLSWQASHDELTGLPNRLSLLSLLSQELASHRARGVEGPVVVFLDLDRLKLVNDSLGHQRGDELLAAIAGRLPGALPDGASVARLGGDEFVVVAPDLTRPEEVQELARAVLAVVNEPVVIAGRRISPSVSAGVVVAGVGQSAHEVLRDADLAMYRAKQHGGAGFEVFSLEMRRRAFDRLELEDQVREALEGEQFLVHYQPVVDLTGHDELVGFEALVRWQHPTRGLLAPAHFIDLVEETGQVVELGEWVLRTAAATVAAWCAEHDPPPLSLAVNVAARQLGSETLLDAVREALQVLTPWTLSLELTESALMADTPAVRRMVDDLAATGARLVIDDFGTGFSSLSYLTRLPVQALKIDRTFVHDLPASTQAASVAAAVVSLADRLGLSTVAEGIETVAQRDSVASLGCRHGQGLLFGDPVPAEQALGLITARR